jgi:hypothetical protein
MRLLINMDIAQLQILKSATIQLCDLYDEDHEGCTASPSQV